MRLPSTTGISALKRVVNIYLGYVYKSHGNNDIRAVSLGYPA
jgi:hypothetical protein